MLDVSGLVWDGADIVNAALYAMEGNWVMAATSIACALPVIGTAVAGVTKAIKLAKAGKIIEKTLQVAGKLYTTIETAKTALELTGDAKMEYAVNGGRMTLGVAAKMVGAVAMASISMLTVGNLMKDVTSLPKVSDIDMNTKTQETPTKDGLCVELEGNAFIDIGSGHYEAHKSMEAFGNQYRKGALYGKRPTIGTYNRTFYDSLKARGLNNKNAADAVRRAYGQ